MLLASSMIDCRNYRASRIIQAYLVSVGRFAGFTNFFVLSSWGSAALTPGFMPTPAPRVEAIFFEIYDLLHFVAGALCFGSDGMGSSWG